MKTRLSKGETLERIMENAPNKYSESRERILREALGQNLIYRSIDSAVRRAGKKPLNRRAKTTVAEIWDAQKLYEKFNLCFAEIGMEIAGVRPSPWRDVPNVVLSGLKAYVAGCIRLRKGGNQHLWRKEAVLETEPVIEELAKEKGITVAAMRLEVQQAEFPEGHKIKTDSADKFARRVAPKATNPERKGKVRTNLR